MQTKVSLPHAKAAKTAKENRNLTLKSHYWMMRRFFEKTQFLLTFADFASLAWDFFDIVSAKPLPTWITPDWREGNRISIAQRVCSDRSWCGTAERFTLNKRRHRSVRLTPSIKEQRQKPLLRNSLGQTSLAFGNPHRCYSDLFGHYPPRKTTSTDFGTPPPPQIRGEGANSRTWYVPPRW